MSAKEKYFYDTMRQDLKTEGDKLAARMLSEIALKNSTRWTTTGRKTTDEARITFAGDKAGVLAATGMLGRMEEMRAWLGEEGRPYCEFVFDRESGPEPKLKEVIVIVQVGDYANALLLAQKAQQHW